MNAKRLFEHTFTPINTLRGEMDKRQIRKQGCVGASEERAHDSDVTDEISELAGFSRNTILEVSRWASRARWRSGWRRTPTGRSSQPLLSSHLATRTRARARETIESPQHRCVC